MQISARFAAVRMQMPCIALHEAKALRHRPASSGLRTSTGFTSCTLSPVIYATFPAQVCCLPPGIVSVSVGTF